MAATATAEPIPFALTPAAATADLIDYRTKEGYALYEAGVKQLIKDKTFNLTPTDLRAFIQAVKVKSQEHTWQDVTEIPIELVDPEETLDLWSDYGVITMHQIQEHACTYIATQTRQAQNNYMLYMCLQNSLSTTARATVQQHEDEYQLTIAGTRYNSGAAYFKVMLKKAYTDTNATAKNLRNQIADLRLYIVKINFDITVFNEYVRDRVNELAVRDQVAHDLMNNLFTAYKAVPHMKGLPTKKRYTSATVFVDHHSHFSYVYLQQSTNAEETIQAKEAFERFSDSHGIKVRHYHADNGRFAENRWVVHVKEKGQTMSFSGVNAHHQNGVAER
jgi:hypothetical protein